MFHIDQQSRVPLYQQLKRQVLSLAAVGILKENEQMPSVRKLASDLGINPNTVQKAYSELELEGLIYTLPGRGSFLADAQAHIEHLSTVFQRKIQQLIEEALRVGYSKAELKDLFFRILEEVEDSDLRTANKRDADGVVEKNLAEERAE